MPKGRIRTSPPHVGPVHENLHPQRRPCALLTLPIDRPSPTPTSPRGQCTAPPLLLQVHVRHEAVDNGVARRMESAAAVWVHAKCLASRAPCLLASGPLFATLLRLVEGPRPWAMCVCAGQASLAVRLGDETELHGNPSINNRVRVVRAEAFFADATVLFQLGLRVRDGIPGQRRRGSGFDVGAHRQLALDRLATSTA